MFASFSVSPGGFHAKGVKRQQVWVRGRAITWLDSVSSGVPDPDGRMFAASSEIRVNSVSRGTWGTRGHRDDKAELTDIQPSSKLAEVAGWDGSHESLAHLQDATSWGHADTNQGRIQWQVIKIANIRHTWSAVGKYAFGSFRKRWEASLNIWQQQQQQKWVYFSTKARTKATETQTDFVGFWLILYESYCAVCFLFLFFFILFFCQLEKDEVIWEEGLSMEKVRPPHPAPHWPVSKSVWCGVFLILDWRGRTKHNEGCHSPGLYMKAGWTNSKQDFMASASGPALSSLCDGLWLTHVSRTKSFPSQDACVVVFITSIESGLKQRKEKE